MFNRSKSFPTHPVMRVSVTLLIAVLLASMTPAYFPRHAMAQTETNATAENGDRYLDQESLQDVRREVLGGLDESDEIVYIDSNGYIRVLDPDQTADNPVVRWRSPEGDWHDAATGDFNGDGDAEIVAIREESTDDNRAVMRMTIYDPVVPTGPLIPPIQRINGIPWEELYTTTLTGDPLAVATGQFTVGESKTGIVVGTSLPDRPGSGDTTPSNITLLDPMSRDGRQWSVRFVRSFDNEWTVIRTGDVDNAGVDEVVLVDRGLSELSVYRVANEMSDSDDRIFRNESQSKKWNDAQVVSLVNNSNQLAAVRNAPVGSFSLEIAQFAHTGQMNWDTVETEWYNPAPERILSAKTTDDSHDILYLLRNVPTDDTTRPRMFVHLSRSGTNPQHTFASALDSDNGFQEGTSGDVLGNDGFDELIIIRNNSIRIFTEPESSEDWVNFGRSTNLRTLHTADLDANGYVQPSQLAADPSAIDAMLAQAEISDQYSIALFDGAEGLSIPFSYEVQGNPSWIEVTASNQTTPATFRLVLDAVNLFPPSEYRTIIDVTTSYADIVNSELSIPIKLTVTSDIGISPSKAIFDFSPCEEPLPTDTQGFSVGGPEVKFDARVSPQGGSTESVPWATVEKAGDTLPSTVTLTVDPNLRTADREEAVLIISVDGSEVEQSASIFLLCADHQNYLPITVR